jgi:exopolyphosphatase / guanosine-5'-triphosphate,3'-diphosphate pyrophosphatase
VGSNPIARSNSQQLREFSPPIGTSNEGEALATITPRWEWRAFGARFGRAEAAFAALTPTEVHESDELYLLGRAVNNVKIRDGLLDIKVLVEINADGLEMWMPVMKSSFPVPASEIEQAFDAMRVSAPALGRESYTRDQLRDEVVKPHSSVRRAEVHKRRARYKPQGCMAELVELQVNGRSTRSVAIESEDPQAVIHAVRSAGLDDWVNTSYNLGLSHLLDGVPSRYAVIDCGTNSIKFHVGERDDAGGWRTVIDRAEITRLGEGLQVGGQIRPEAIERTVVALQAMVEEARQHDIRAIAAVGTAGLRMARNVSEVISAIRDRCGLSIEVIPGEEEARLSYLAVVSGLGLGQGAVAVFETGGGSSQFTLGHGEQVDEQFSVNVGAVRYTERFGLSEAVSDEVLGKALAAISADLSALDGRAPADALVGMGGAITNISAVKHGLATYDPDVVQGSTLERTEIDRQIELYRSRDAEARRSIVGLQPKRADVILAGACIVRTAMDKLGQDSLTVSDRGLRHGLLLDRFGA